MEVQMLRKEKNALMTKMSCLEQQVILCRGRTTGRIRPPKYFPGLIVQFSQSEESFGGVVEMILLGGGLISKSKKMSSLRAELEYNMTHHIWQCT